MFVCMYVCVHAYPCVFVYVCMCFVRCGRIFVPSVNLELVSIQFALDQQMNKCVLRLMKYCVHGVQSVCLGVIKMTDG